MIVCNKCFNHELNNAGIPHKTKIDILEYLMITSFQKYSNSIGNVRIIMC